MANTYLEKLVAALSDAMKPLTDSLASAESFAGLLAQMGWKLDTNPDMDAVRSGFVGITSKIDKFSQDVAMAKGLTDLVEDVHQLLAALEDSRNVDFSMLPKPLNQEAFWQTLPSDLFEYLLYRYLERYHLSVFGITAFIGVLKAVPQKADDTAGRLAYQRLTADFSLISKTAASPQDLFKDEYSWGSQLKTGPLMFSLASLLKGFGAAAQLYPVSEGFRNLYFDPSNPDLETLKQVVVSPFQLVSSDDDSLSYVKPILVILPIAPKDDLSAAPNGLLLLPYVTGGTEKVIPLQPGVDLTLSGGFEADFIRIHVYPDEVDVKMSSSPGAEIKASGRVDIKPSLAKILVGDAASTRMELRKAHLGLDVQSTLNEIRVTIEAALDQAKLVLDFSDADSFLQKVLGDKPQSFDFNLGLQWSNRTGLHFLGQPRLEIVLAMNLNVGNIFFVDRIYLSLDASTADRSTRFEVSIAAHVSLGPVKASAERLGLLINLKQKEMSSPGNLGLLDIGFSFKPPNGLGILVDAGPITGGGFLEIDTANGRYSGLLQLSLPSIAITAIGLLDTRLPGGAKGFSFLIIITFKFPPIQLGFGFTLNGLGGLAGIHRTMITEVLQSGIRSGSVNHILFPANPVRDAPQIISDLRAIFPPVENRFVFGPMAIIGYGSPSFVEVELGIILELPAPVRLVLLGKINAFLPRKEPKDAVVVELHLDILGVLDFGRKELAIDATLHDSRIVSFNLFGDMAMRLSWGDPPNFAFSVGGLHPQFQPPPGFPELRRLTLALGSGENPRLSLQAYFAVTSNTFQFGARAELYAEAAGFNLSGWVGFDVLIIFQPFSLTADLSAGVALRQGSQVLASVHLSATLTGPGPWHAWGEASVSLLFFNVSVSFDAIFGEALPQIEAPPVDPWPVLEIEIKKTDNWSATLPPDSSRVVTLAQPAADEAGAPSAANKPSLALIDPLGGLTLRQKAVPFERTLTKFGQVKLSSSKRFAITGVTIGSQPATTGNPVVDYFAPGQFEEMTDAEKLSRPSFEQMQAGTIISSDAVAFGKYKETDFTYKTEIIDAPDAQLEPYKLKPNQQTAALQRSAAAQSLLNTTGLDKYRPAPSKPALVTLGEEEYLIMDTTKWENKTDDIAGKPNPKPMTKGAMFQALAAYLKEHPEAKGKYEVVPAHEV